MRQRQRLAEQIVAFVEENWRRRVTVKEVGARFKVDAALADRLFRSVKGKPIGRYRQEKQKEYVLCRIHDGACRAYELARELGYREEHSFTRWVKKAFGVSWRELCQRQLDGSHRSGSAW